jgi:hypothetical protein
MNYFIALMMEAVRTSETLVYSNETTWRYIPEGSNLHSRRRENLKSRISFMSLQFLWSGATPVDRSELSRLLELSF